MADFKILGPTMNGHLHLPDLIIPPLNNGLSNQYSAVWFAIFCFAKEQQANVRVMINLFGKTKAAFTITHFPTLLLSSNHRRVISVI